MTRRRKTVKSVVRDLRKEYPSAVIEVLKEDGWSVSRACDQLPESEWSEYFVNEVRHYENLIVIKAS